MPRWASRLTLRIVDFRIERLQDISQEDALAEGMQPLLPEGARGVYERQWRLSYFQKRHRWQASPWVQAVTFEVIHKPVREALAEVA